MLKAHFLFSIIHVLFVLLVFGTEQVNDLKCQQCQNDRSTSNDNFTKFGHFKRLLKAFLFGEAAVH